MINMLLVTHLIVCLLRTIELGINFVSCGKEQVKSNQTKL